MSEYTEIKRSHDEGWFTIHERAQVLINIIEKKDEKFKKIIECGSREHGDRESLGQALVAVDQDIDDMIKYAKEALKLTEE